MQALHATIACNLSFIQRSGSASFRLAFSIGKTCCLGNCLEQTDMAPRVCEHHVGPRAFPRWNPRGSVFLLPDLRYITSSISHKHQERKHKRSLCLVAELCTYSCWFISSYGCLCALVCVCLCEYVHIYRYVYIYINIYIYIYYSYMHICKILFVDL